MCGGQYYEDIKLGFEGEKLILKDFKINFFHKALRTQEDYIETLREGRLLIDHFKQENKEELSKYNLDFYLYSFFYVFFDQYEEIKGQTIQNYLLSISVLLLLVTTLYNFSISLVLVLMIIFISSNLWTLIWINNFIFPGTPVEINAILLVNFIISIGLSVEFCIHTLVRYTKAKGDHASKLKKIMGEIISVVF